VQEQVHVNAAFAASGGSYGSRRVTRALQDQGLRIGRYRVRTLMREAGLRTSWKRKFVWTTSSKHTLPVAQNVYAGSYPGMRFDTGWEGGRFDYAHWR
jgi:transposase InsO family protein